MAAHLPKAKLRFIDVGVNLTDHCFRGVYRGKRCHRDDLSSVLERAKAVGVQTMLITGGCLKESVEAVALARELGMYCTVGCHPTRCNEFLTKAATPEAYLEALDKLITENLDVVKAVGECGLDYDRLEFCPADVQRRFFPLHFQLAAKHKLPLFLHNRNTGDDFFNIMKEHIDVVRECGGLVHSFTGETEELRALLELGLYISINGCSMKTEDNIRMVSEIPLDRLMLETDAPWCDIRPTHASYQYRWPRPAATPAPKAKRATGKGDEATNGLSELQAFLAQHAQTLLPIEYPVAKEPAKFAEGHLIRGRNEPCCITQVFEVLFSLRHAQVESAVHLSEVVYANTLRLFKLDVEGASSSAAA